MGCPELPVRLWEMPSAPRRARGSVCHRGQPTAGHLRAVGIRSETGHTRVTAPSAGGGSPGTATIAGVSGWDPRSASLSLVQFQIRALESQKRQQEIVLRRKTQEVRGGMGGLPPRSPQPLWGSWPPRVAQRHRVPWTVPALGAGCPKEQRNCPRPGAAEPGSRG